MAEEKKKTKIDLKARLGNKAAGGAAPAPTAVPVPAGIVAPPGIGGVDDGGRSSAVPPSGPGGHAPSAPAAAPVAAAIPAPTVSKPMGIAPPPNLSPGIPLPPFGAARQAPAREPKATAQAQTIKVDVGEEVIAERKKASKRAALYAIIAAIIAAPVGLFIGQAMEKGARGKAAQEGAGLIEKDVKVANDKLHELAEKLGDGQKQLGEKKFPTELVTALAGINIPFDASNLDNRQVGSLPGKVLRKVLAYTSAVGDVNKQKEALKNVLGAAQAPITKAWKEEKEPPVNFAALFSRQGDKAFVEIVPVKEPFPFAKDWPSSITITKYENKKPVEKKANRWVKGDLFGSDPVAMPLDPAAMAAYTNDAIVGRLSKALFDIREILEGKKDDPAHETAGLMKDGEDLASELHKVAIAR